MNSRTLQTDHIRSLVDQVQHNCDVCDAHHAQDYTLCVYLLKMREYFRWEHGYALTDTLPSEALNTWIAEREERWDELEHAEYRSIQTPEASYPPFDESSIQRTASAHSMTYGAGLGSGGRAHFFLAETIEESEREGAVVRIVGKELARDLTAPPAMHRNGVIIVRMESLQRSLWELIQDWMWKRPPGAMANLLALHHYDANPDAALDSIAQIQLEHVINHELGERRAGFTLGEEWSSFILSVAGTPHEMLARAVRDQLADALSTLPSIVETHDWTGLHGHLASLGSIRNRLSPKLRAVYRQCVRDNAMDALESMLPIAQAHWDRSAKKLLNTWRHGQLSEPLQVMDELALA
ncbi:MAG: Sfum_1244 family protein [Gammaproteobacteria bacterium]